MLCSNTDSKVHYIKQLSILELSLLVACKRTIELRGNDKSFNLEMILVGKFQTICRQCISLIS